MARVQSQVDVIHLVRSTGTIVSNPHLHTVKSCPGKSKPIKNGHHIDSVMLAIVQQAELEKNSFMVRTRLFFAKTITYNIMTTIPISCRAEKIFYS